MFYTDDAKTIYISPSDRKYDPVVVFRQLVLQSGNQINVWLVDWSDPDPLVRLRAEEMLAPVARAAFDLKPFADGAGATDAEALRTLDHYLRWQEGKG